MALRVDTLIYCEMANKLASFFIIILFTERYLQMFMTVSLCVCVLVVLYMLMGVTV